MLVVKLVWLKTELVLMFGAGGLRFTTCIYISLGGPVGDSLVIGRVDVSNEFALSSWGLIG